MSERLHRYDTRLLPLLTLLLLVAVVSRLALVNDVLDREVTLALIDLVLVVSLYTFTGNSGVFSFCHIGFMAIGAYTTGLLTIDPVMKLAVMSQLPDFIERAAWGSLPALLMGGALAALFALVISAPLMRLSGIVASLATFAVLNIVFIVTDNWAQVTNGTQGLANVPTVTTANSATVWALLVVCAAFAFQFTRVGLRLRASREDDVAARAIGVGIQSERRIAFVLSAFLGGIGGGLFAQFLGSFTAQSFYLEITFLIIVMLVVGGTNSLAGAVVGTIFIAFVSALLVRVEAGVTIADFEIPGRPGLKEVVLALIMLTTLIVRPTGITGGREMPSFAALTERRRYRAASRPTRARIEVERADGCPGGD